MNKSFELPSLEEIEQIERQRSQAIESLQISDGNVKCQSCGIAVPMLRNMTKPKSNRIETLQKQLNWLEQHCHYINRLNHRTNNNNDNDIGVVKQIKAELAELQEEDAAYDKLRSLSLYSCIITGFKFVCSSCYDKVYMFTIAKQRF